MNTPLDYFFNERAAPETARSLTAGPLAPYLTAYAERLRREGYAIHSGRLQLRMLGRFNAWLERNHIGADDVDAALVERYRCLQKKTGRIRRGDSAALDRMLGIVRSGKTETPQAPMTASQILLARFQFDLRQQRGLCEETITGYTRVAEAFLSECLPVEVPDFRRISANDVTGFVQRQVQRISTRTAANVVAALRSFLRHLLHRGEIATDLSACVPTVARWALSDVPKYLRPEQIQCVLDSCDRNHADGKRDYAILLLLARLGLRASEVVLLSLDDIDWESGVITVRGKGKRVAQMPLPVDVGAALADYIRHARPNCLTRRVFIRKRAPLVGFTKHGAIGSLVVEALKKAGINASFRGSHLFRHSLATTMLQQGASLGEIGDLLRHRRADTTVIYAKVDLNSLRSIALPWPGGGR